MSRQEKSRREGNPASESQHRNERVEGWVLGAVMDADGPSLRSTARQLVEQSGCVAEDFADPAHRLYWQATVGLATRGRSADCHSVAAALAGVEGVPEGALKYLAGLQGANEATPEAFAGHCEELRRLAHLRQLEAFHRAALARLSEEVRPDPSKLGAELEGFARTFAASSGGDEHGDVDMVELLGEWEDALAGRSVPRLTTGIEILDQVAGGLVPNMNVLGGLPSDGKTALADTMILHWLSQGLKVGLVGLEDGTRHLCERYVASECQVDYGDVGIVRLAPWQEERLQVAAATYIEWTRERLLVFRQAGITGSALVAKLKSWIYRHGVQVAVIDHMGEVLHDRIYDRNDLNITHTYSRVRDLAVNTKTPILALAHFNRQTLENADGKPRMQSFRDSAGIEQTMRWGIGVWTKPGDPPDEVRCTVLKRTKGAKGATAILERELRAALIKKKAGRLMDETQEEDRSQRGTWRRHG